MPASYRLSEIAAQLGGRVLGDAEVRISQIASLDSAQPDQISFLANSKFHSLLAVTKAGALILPEQDADSTTLPRIVTDNPYAYFAKVSALLNPLPEIRPGIHPAALIGPGAKIDASASVAATAVIGENASIGAHSVIGEGCSIGANVVIGCRTRLYPRVVVYHDCVLGDDLIIHSGAVIGADGFGIAMDQGRWLKIPQIGRVVIGNDVEIGANTTIDRGALNDTVIEEGVKIDNLVQIAHNVRVGAHTAIAGCAGIAGSTTIGRYCQIGGSAAITGHVTIVDHVIIAGFAMITRSINEAGTYGGGFPFGRAEDWRRTAVHLRNLDELVQRVKKLEKGMDGLQKDQI